jgi:hypothetical protein
MNAPFWKYCDTVCASRLKAVFEPLLKLERESAANPGFPVLIQIARAKVAVKVADHAWGSRDRRLNNAVTG